MPLAGATAVALLSTTYHSWAVWHLLLFANCVLGKISSSCFVQTAGAIALLSTAYRAWAVWHANLQLPLIVFGSADMSEIRNYLDIVVRNENRILLDLDQAD